MRLGYFGGSFDPPHLGHLAAASTAASRYDLDRVLLVPTSNQPLKPSGAVATYSDRLAMVSLLCQQDPRLVASSLEAPTDPPAPNYTVDTLQRLHAAEPSASLFVIVGADAFRDLPRWRSPDLLLQLANWIVLTRQVQPPSNMSGTIDISVTPTPLPSLTDQQRARVHLLSGFDHPASATAIRAALAVGQDCKSLLPPAILDYIHQHHLYQTPA